MKKDFTSLILTTSIFLTVALGASIIYFFKIIQNENMYIFQVENTLYEKNINKNNAEDLRDKFTEMAAIDKQVSSYFVDQSKINLFINYLEELGSKNDANLTVESVDTPAGKSNTISVKVSIKGSFNHIMKVLSLLENSPFYVDITQSFINKEIVDTTDKEASTTSNWQADVSFSVLSNQYN